MRRENYLMPIVRVYYSHEFAATCQFINKNVVLNMKKCSGKYNKYVEIMQSLEIIFKSNRRDIKWCTASSLYNSYFIGYRLAPHGNVPMCYNMRLRHTATYLCAII